MSARNAEQAAVGLLLVMALGVADVPAATATGSPAAPAPRRVAAARVPATPRASTTPRDTAMILRGGQEGTVFRTLTVEGEDRIRIDFERPALDVDLDPETAPGLTPGGPREMLERSTPDLSLPLLAATARETSPFLAHPWLSRFATGAVAKFQPRVKDLEHWRLVVADARGEAVASYEGKGDPPREIAWDGRTRSGAPAVPGRTYSHVFEAWDRAGNKRSFVGEGFEIPAYRLTSPTGPTLVFSAAELGDGAVRSASGSAPAIAPIVIEAANWINHAALPGQAFRVSVTARTLDQGSTLAASLARQLVAVTLGDPARLTTTTTVEPDAPPAGTVIIAPAK